MDEVTVKLTAIFQIVNDWLKFTEAKNAILLTFSGAGITAIITYLSASSNILQSLRIGLLIAITFLCFVSLICTISFLPKTNLENIMWLKGKPTRKKKLLDSDNLYYFDHLQKYNSTEFLESISRLYFENKIQPPYRKDYLDISSQIVINAEIASIKLMLSTISVWLLIISMCSIPSALILSLILYKSL